MGKQLRLWNQGCLEQEWLFRKYMAQKKSIKYWLKNLGKIGILLAIKESYLLSKNVLGLGVHPVKTLRSIGREKDRSQQLLILGLPVYVLGLGLVVVWMGRRLLGTTIGWGWGAKITFLSVIVLTGVVLGYLGFWVIKVWKMGRKYE